MNVPVLITAYNRPEKVLALLESLRQSQPKLIYFSVDGPKKHKKMDQLKTQQVAAAVSVIDWDCEIRTRFRETNLGIRKAIPDAVSWVLGENDRVIVLEEDVIVGPQALDFGTEMLSRFEHSTQVGHISLYNVVPRSILSNPASEIRLSRYPESVAWATWKRSWSLFDDDVRWGSFSELGELKKITGSMFGAIQWKLNFQDAKNARISTWAYRWIASLWANGMTVVSPNANLVVYAGADEGSHTTSKLPWTELEIEEMNFSSILGKAIIDEKAESWLSKTVFRETFLGVMYHTAVIIFRIFKPEKH